MITYFWFELNLNFLLDTFAHKGKRKQLVEILVQKGITNKKVLNAIGTIPRHLFMDSGFVDHAYIDKAFPIGAEQTISQPFTVAKQTELLNLEKGAKILEIGTGSGFQTAVLIEMGMHVFSIERQNELFKKTKLFLPRLHYKPKKMVLKIIELEFNGLFTNIYCSTYTMDCSKNRL